MTYFKYPLGQDRAAEHRYFVPYVTSWSAEPDLPDIVVERRGTGIAYLDESIHDRYRGVLWYRVAHSPGNGRPDFRKVHPARQRRAMIRLLCQVCGGEADRTADGVLWLMALGETDDGNWPDYPDGVAAVEPPTCSVCVKKALQVCPALRQGAIVFRVKECPVVGVRGALYECDSRGVPIEVGHVITRFTAPAIRWTRASALVRELRGCTVLSIEEFSVGL